MKKKKINISIDRVLCELLDEYSTNKSRTIELLLIEYFNSLGIDTKEIYL